jgi:cytochrome c-type biogenesis protein CcmH
MSFLTATGTMCSAALAAVAHPLYRQAAGRSTSDWIPLGLTVGVLVAAAALYAELGRPDLATTQRDATGSTAVTAPSVATLLPGLEARLREHPEDGSSWMLLAKSYRHLGRIEAARHAYDRAAALGMRQPAFEGELAVLATGTVNRSVARRPQ